MMPFAVGQKLGAYELKFALGSNSYGPSFRARQTGTGREVCLTILAERWPMNGSGRTHAICALDHPNIARVYEIACDNGTLFAATEWAGGETLRQKLRKGPLLALKAAEYALQIAQALVAGHAGGVVHGDLKPESIMITREGVKVLDFGFATLGLPPGPNVIADYASPEQVRGEPETERSDIFGFGALLYEMLSGERPFLRNSLVSTTAAILNEAPASLTKLSPALDRIVRHCLEKDPANRFGTAAELSFAIESFSGLNVAPRPARKMRRSSWTRPILIALPLCVLGILFGAFVARQFLRPTINSPLLFHYMTSSGHDSAPSASPDGKHIVFTSERNGIARIWLMDLVEGREAPLTEGPLDHHPRFSHDGSNILFRRRDGAVDSLFVVPTSGGAPKKILDDITGADWCPTRREIAWVRITGNTSVIGVVDIDGKKPVEISRVQNQILQYPRWSPDGSLIAASAGASEGFHQSIYVTSVDGSGRQYYLWPPPNPGSLSSPVWSEDGASIFYFQSESHAGENGWPGGAAHIVHQQAKTGTAQIVGFSQQSAQVVDALGPGRLVFDTSSGRENLQEIPLAKNSEPRFLTLGNSSDKDPVYTPDGKRVLFASLRGGGSDIWELSRETGATIRIVHNPSTDGEPFVSADGTRLYWSSNRENGHFEIFTSSIDGGYVRRVTRDGVDAEHPSVTPDEAWVVYNSYNPDRKGVWKTSPAGIGDTLLVKGATRWPEVSPDGQYVLYTINKTPAQRSIQVVRVENGAPAPFEIKLEIRQARTSAAVGRARWMPNGRAIAFIGQDEQGHTGIFTQDFAPGRDTSAARRPLAGFDPQRAPQSFAISRDGSVLTVSGWEQVFGIEEVANVPGAGLHSRQ